MRVPLMLPGKHRNIVYLEDGKVTKIFGGERDKALLRLKRELNFYGHSIHAPEIVGFSEDDIKLELKYIEHSKNPDLDYLITNNDEALNKIFDAIDDIHLVTNYDVNLDTIDYKDNAIKLFGNLNLDLRNLMIEKQEKFEILNNPKSKTLIHGDLWSGNILLNDDVYFVDPENEYLKTADSFGNKYLDPAFLLVYDGFIRSYKKIFPENDGERQLSIENVGKFYEKIKDRYSDNLEDLSAAADIILLEKIKRGYELVEEGVTSNINIKTIGLCEKLVETSINNSLDKVIDEFYEYVDKTKTE